MTGTVAVTADLAELGAVDARDLITAGAVSSIDLVEACLARVEARDAEIGAWACLAAERAREQARAIDAGRRSGRPAGPLAGLPVGVKDIIDTADMPTENGTPIDAGRRPRRDASLVSRLRAAGAVLPGKTVTTELAFLTPAQTRNPRDPSRTPGGSSSGSAAAVACGMVPLAVGTQTGGSVIRPAAYCGVVGFKPTHGLIGRTGVLTTSLPLDTVGVFARSVEDAALLGDVLAGYDPEDPASRAEAPPRLLDLARSEAAPAPTFAFVRPPAWIDAEPSTRSAFEALAARLGRQCRDVPLPEAFSGVAAAHMTLMRTGFARHLRRYYEVGGDRLSPLIRTTIEEGREVRAVDYLAALDLRETLNDALEGILAMADAVLCPATLGEAPIGLTSTGSPALAAPWTFLGVPAVTLPLMEGPAGLPLGVQLVGRRGHDGRLLRTARWLEAWARRLT